MRVGFIDLVNPISTIKFRIGKVNAATSFCIYTGTLEVPHYGVGLLYIGLGESIMPANAIGNKANGFQGNDAANGS